MHATLYALLVSKIEQYFEILAAVYTDSTE